MAADYYVTKADMDTVANAIREKGATTEPLSFPTGFADAVKAIPSGGSGKDIFKDKFTNSTTTYNYPISIITPKVRADNTSPSPILYSYSPGFSTLISSNKGIITNAIGDSGGREHNVSAKIDIAKGTHAITSNDVLVGDKKYDARKIFNKKCKVIGYFIPGVVNFGTNSSWVDYWHPYFSLTQEAILCEIEFDSNGSPISYTVNEDISTIGDGYHYTGGSNSFYGGSLTMLLGVWEDIE